MIKFRYDIKVKNYIISNITFPQFSLFRNELKWIDVRMLRLKTPWRLSAR